MMNYSYQVPGTGPVTPATGFNGPYFQVGNECCNGSMIKDADARVMVMFDYNNELSTGVNVTTITYTVTPVNIEGLAITGQTVVSNVSTFIVSGGVIGTTYAIEALASLDNGEIWIDHITITVKDCSPATSSSGGLLFGPSPVIVSNTLYYTATSGQTVFPLDTLDIFGQTGSLIDNNAIVYANGTRLIPNINYTLDVLNNRVIFAYPLGDGQSVIIDIVSEAIAPVVINDAIISASLYYTSTAQQVAFSLSVPDNFGNTASLENSLALVYRGGNRMTPIEHYTLDAPNNRVIFVFPLAVGENVVFDLTISAFSTNWWTNLPTTLPPTPGKLWNNGGFICVSQTTP